MKISRIPGDEPSLKREAENLVALHAAKQHGFTSIPRMLSFGRSKGHSILVETALAGQAMNPNYLRRRLKPSIEAVFDWLIDLHISTATSNRLSPDWFARLVDRPIDRIESALRLSMEEREVLESIRDIAEPLRCARFPLVFSHGDLSDPNILVFRSGDVGVVDWELAEPMSLPGADLFFFLNFVANVRFPRTNAEDVSGFRQTFFSRESWVQHYISRYAETMRLPLETLRPLFVLCFTRYLSDLIVRMRGTGQTLDAETAAWLRTDRAYILWREAVKNSADLRFD